MPTRLVRENVQEGRVAARMPVEIQKRIMEAASLTGSTLNQFLVSAAIDRANEVLERERAINHNFEAAKIVLDLIANTPKPNESLKKAMRRRRQLLAESD